MLSALAYALPLVVLALAALWAISARKRRTRNGDKNRQAEKTPERKALEEDLLQRLERLRNKQNNAADAIAKDPRRAANAVRAMMKDKKDRPKT